MPRLSDPETADIASCRAMLSAGSRSFATAARLLPRKVRDAAVALYAFCRVADDTIDDGTGGDGGIVWLRERLSRAYADQPLDLPADRAFARVVRRFTIPPALPRALLDGFEWDVEGRRYEDLASLREYAIRVAGTVGAMMATLMGVRDPGRLTAAIDLGVAMQLSNIARDVGEDARAGRLYLPLRWLAEVGIDPDAFLAAPRHSPELGCVVQRLLSAANQHYQRASPGITHLPLNSRFGIGAASLLYAEIGDAVARRDYDAVSSRAVVKDRRKLRVLAAGLPAFAFPLAPLPRVIVPEYAFLIDAVTRQGRRQPIEGWSKSWWNLPERTLWAIDLFQRLERRDHIGT